MKDIIPHTINHQQLVIADICIKQDDAGRYCLNDFHKAAGGENRHLPFRFMRLDQTQELIEEIEQNPLTPEMVLAQKTVKGGKNPGTYVVKELVYSYAMWISAKFHLHVIRAYDALVVQSAITLANLPKIPKNPHLAVKKAVEKLACTRDVTFSKVYHRLYDRFQVESYKDIPPEYCLAAVEYVKALEGEYLPKLETSKASLDSKTLANIQALMVNYELMRKFTESTLSQNFILRNIWEALRLISPNDAAYYNRYIADTNQLARKVSIALDFRNRQNQPLISPDGSVIHFQSGVMFTGINPKWFSMRG